MKSEVRKRVFKQAKRASHARSRPQRLWATLAAVGSVGWMVVLPMVFGAMAGRWLDAKLQTGLSFTLALLLVGLGSGAYSIWRYFLRNMP